MDTWEYDWLKEMLRDVEHEFIVTNTFENLPPLENCVVVANHAVNYRAYLDALRQAGKRYGFVLLSDENLREPLEYVHDPHCVFIARNYFHPFYYQNPKIFTFGLGYKKGFTSVEDELKEFKDRKYDWCFAGSVHDGKRQKAIDKLKNYSSNYKVHTCSGFNAADGLSTEEYRKLMNDSKFVLCPQGQDSMDSFRIYEALEAGTIPVTLKHTETIRIEPSYWHAIFRSEQELPFVVGETWEDAISKMKNEVKQDTQKECKKFWDKQKNVWSAQFKERVGLLQTT